MNHEFERRLEGKVLLRIQKMHNPILDKIMLIATIMGNGGLIWVAVILGYIIAKRKTEALILIISLAFCAFLNNIVIKSFFKRARPCDIFGNYPPMIKRPWGSSCPSGHTATSFAMAVALCKLNLGIGVPAIVIATIIGFSRMYLFVHYPSDVIIGVISGVLITLFITPIVLEMLGLVV